MQTAFEGGSFENYSFFMGSKFKQQLLGSQSCCWLKSAWCELEKVHSLEQMQPGPRAQSGDQAGELGGTQDRLSWSLQPDTLVLTVRSSRVGGFQSAELWVCVQRVTLLRLLAGSPKPGFPKAPGCFPESISKSEMWGGREAPTPASFV